MTDESLPLQDSIFKGKAFINPIISNTKKDFSNIKKRLIEIDEMKFIMNSLSEEQLNKGTISVNEIKELISLEKELIEKGSITTYDDNFELKKINSETLTQDKIYENKSGMSLAYFLPDLIKNIVKTQADSLSEILQNLKKEERDTYGVHVPIPNAFKKLKTRDDSYYWDLLKDNRIKAELDAIHPDLYQLIMTGELYYTDYNALVFKALFNSKDNHLTIERKENIQCIKILINNLLKSAKKIDATVIYSKSVNNCDPLWQLIQAKVANLFEQNITEADNIPKPTEGLTLSYAYSVST
jgi:peptidyl-tRNA hydrolase